MGRPEGGRLLKAVALAVVFLAQVLWGQGFLEVVSEGSLPKPLGEPPPRWEEVIKEGLFQAVKQAALELGAGDQVEESLRTRFSAFIASFRVLERWDFPFRRQVKLEVRVNKDGLLKYLRRMGLIEKGERYRIVIQDLRDYRQMEAVEERLGGSKDVLGFSLREATRGSFTWEVLLREGVDPEEVLGGLPLLVVERKGREVRMRWRRPLEEGHEGP